MTSFLPVNNNPTPKDLAMEDVKTPTVPDSTEAQASSSAGTSSHDSLPQPPSSSQRAPSTTSTGDETTIAEDDGDRDQSDTEQGGDDAAPPSKKKKGQRFFCTDFPPCQLSFTRSEHLARHIRKHTGERPFQCHCSRRFSRLDNLRQHAQTVHVNEEIPGDSLAATGTRFQRQIRTDRVRPPGRARAGTTGSQGGHTRGHSRNLSTSSITSTASTISQPPEIRRRPPPLIMAGDGSGRPHPPLGVLGEPSTPPAQVRNMTAQSPGGYPTFSAGGGSPHYASPISGGLQPGFWDGKGHVRRLSVPSGANPFTFHGTTYPPPYVTSVPQSHGSFTPSTSGYASPTTSSYAPSRDEGMSATEADLRRRTWHPSTYYPRPATSGLASYEPPNTLRPAFGAKNADTQPPRLPGIESFDKVIQGRPLTPPLRKPSPMQVDTPSRGPPGPPNHGYAPGFAAHPSTTRPPPPIAGPGHRRGQISWDLHYNLTGLNLGSGAPIKEAATPWGQQTLGEIHSVGSRPTSSDRPPSHQATNALPQHEPSTPQNTKRYGFQAPGGTPGSHITRTSPEDSSSSEGVATPSTISMDYHPAIVHSNDHVEQSSIHDAPVNNEYRARERRPSMLDPSSGAAPGMGRLEALVAVATSEGKAATRLF